MIIVGKYPQDVIIKDILTQSDVNMYIVCAENKKDAVVKFHNTYPDVGTACIVFIRRFDNMGSIASVLREDKKKREKAQRKIVKKSEKRAAKNKTKTWSSSKKKETKKTNNSKKDKK